MSWESYFIKNRVRPVREIYTRALPYLSSESGRVAIDLGCGVGTEAADLVARGWQVLGVDSEKRALEFTKQRIASISRARFTPLLCRFEELTSLPAAQLIFCYHSISFCAAESFHRLWPVITGSIKNGGVLAGSFFGPKDDWAKSGKVTGIGPDDLRIRLDGFRVEYLEEISGGKSAYHSIDVVARKL